MADLGAIHEDVRFDRAAARRLSAELRASADTLTGQVGLRNAIANRATQEWRGRYAREFGDRMVICASDARALADALRLAANQVDELARLAREEQNRREQAREWERQQRNQNVFENVKEIFFGEDDNPPVPPPVDPPTYVIPPAISRSVRG